MTERCQRLAEREQVLAPVVSDQRLGERATLIVTTNLPFWEWTQVFPNPQLCKALLDRITDRAHIIETGTESYRFRPTVEARQGKRKPPEERGQQWPWGGPNQVVQRTYLFKI
jgi:hypothetical protein